MRLYVKLDVDTRMDARILRAGPSAELLHYRGMQLAKAQLTDGAIDAAHLPFLSVGIDGGASEAASALVREGIWVETATGWEIVGWAEDNLTRAEIDERRSGKQAAAEKGNHERWHINGRTSPDCRICVANGSQVRSPCDDSTNRNGSPEGKGETEPQGETEPTLAAVAVDASAAAPNGHGRPSARKRDLLWEVVIDVCGLTQVELTPSARGRVNKAVAELRSVQATPEEVRRASRNYRDRWPEAELTATALSANWPTLLASNGRPEPKEDAPWAS